jgi:hypothetical protein
MKYGMMVSKGELGKKPPHGSPCTRCGLCCMATLCPLGVALFKREEGPCPALEKEPDGTYGCGLINHPARWGGLGCVISYGKKAMSDAAALLIGSGTGCDARFNGEPANKEFYAKLERLDRSSRSATKAAKRLWGIR